MESVHALVAALQKRYSARDFDASRPVPQEVIDACVDAVMTAPSAVGRYPYRLHVIPGDKANELGRLCDEDVAKVFPSVMAARKMSGVSNCVFYDCGACFLFTRRPDLTPNPEKDVWIGYDVGLASQTIIDIAELAGLGSICIGVVQSVCPQKVKDFLELPEGEDPLLAICIGYTKGHRAPGRHPITVIRH